MSDLLPPEPPVQRISRILAWVAGAAILLGCSLPITIDVIARLVLNRGPRGELRDLGLRAGRLHRAGPRLHRHDQGQHPGRHPRRPPAARPCAPRPTCWPRLALAVVAGALAWFAWGTLAQSWSMDAQVDLAAPGAHRRCRRAIWWLGLAWFALRGRRWSPILALAIRLMRGDRAAVRRADRPGEPRRRDRADATCRDAPRPEAGCGARGTAAPPP